MKKRVIALLAVLIIMFILPMTAFSKEEEVTSKQIKIGYFQIEKYYEFNDQLFHIIEGLIDNGMITGVSLEGLTKDSLTIDMWNRVCRTQDENSKVIFVKEGYLDSSEKAYSDLLDEEIGKEIQSRVDKNDIDLMLTMGTSGGLITKEYTNSYFMNFVASDPVSSGIIENSDYSGDRRCWAYNNPEGNEMALGVMNDIFAPKKVGLVYANNDEAYIYSCAQSIDKFASENNIEVYREFVDDEFPEEDYENYVEEMRKAHEKLVANGIDTYILTTSLLENREDMEYTLEPFYNAGIPVFSINSTADVKNGALAAVELLDYRDIGHFAADVVEEYSEGKCLDELYQIYHPSPYLVLNSTTIHRTGYTLPFSILVTTDVIYR